MRTTFRDVSTDVCFEYSSLSAARSPVSWPTASSRSGTNFTTASEHANTMVSKSETASFCSEGKEKRHRGRAGHTHSVMKHATKFRALKRGSRQTGGPLEVCEGFSQVLTGRNEEEGKAKQRRVSSVLPVNHDMVGTEGRTQAKIESCCNNHANKNNNTSVNNNNDTCHTQTKHLPCRNTPSFGHRRPPQSSLHARPCRCANVQKFSSPQWSPLSSPSSPRLA